MNATRAVLSPQNRRRSSHSTPPGTLLALMFPSRFPVLPSTDRQRSDSPNPPRFVRQYVRQNRYSKLHTGARRRAHTRAAAHTRIRFDRPAPCSSGRGVRQRPLRPQSSVPILLSAGRLMPDSSRSTGAPRASPAVSSLWTVCGIVSRSLFVAEMESTIYVLCSEFARPPRPGPLAVEDGLAYMLGCGFRSRPHRV